MVTERKLEISQERRDVLGADLRILEVDNLQEIQANYSRFAETIKPILNQAALKLVEHGIFPEEEVANGTVDDIKKIKIMAVANEAESGLNIVVIDPEGKIFICNQIRTGGHFIIDWSSKKEAKDIDYVDFSLLALHTMAVEYREALGFDYMSNSIPYHSRW